MAQKFWTLKDRYVHGHFVRADPENPALVLFEDDIKVKLLCTCGQERLGRDHKPDCNAMKKDGRPEDGTLIRFVPGKPAPAAQRGDLIPHFARATKLAPDRGAYDAEVTRLMEEVKQASNGVRPSDRDPAR